MANSFLFYQNRNYGIVNNETGYGIITFDLELSENHNFSNTVTQYNVEDGSEISDHIQNNLEVGGVTGFITNFSIYDSVIIENKAQIAFDVLRNLWKAKELVDIYTIYHIYEGVAITNISMSRGSDSGESLTCDFSFQELNKVKLQEIEVEVQINLQNMKTSQNQQSAPNKDNGKTQGTSTNWSDVGTGG